MTNSQLNIDPIEVEKFDSQSDKWWDEKSKTAPLHHLNPVRVQFITDRVIVKDKQVLDIGCGGGLLTESLAKRGAMVTGIDASEKLIEIAKQHAQENGLSIQYQTITVEELALEPKFDIVTCMELLEHVPDPGRLIHAAATLTKPNGWLFFSTLNRTFKSYLGAILGAEYILNILPKGTHEYAKFIKPSELCAWLKENDLKIEDISGLHYNPFSKQAFLSPDVTINYLIAATQRPSFGSV